DPARLAGHEQLGLAALADQVRLAGLHGPATGAAAARPALAEPLQESRPAAAARHAGEAGQQALEQLVGRARLEVVEEPVERVRGPGAVGDDRPEQVPGTVAQEVHVRLGLAAADALLHQPADGL